jgi:hypothetical protein
VVPDATLYLAIASENLAFAVGSDNSGIYSRGSAFALSAETGFDLAFKDFGRGSGCGWRAPNNWIFPAWHRVGPPHSSCKPAVTPGDAGQRSPLS